jgi:hypothetical protein
LSAIRAVVVEPQSTYLVEHDGMYFPAIPTKNRNAPRSGKPLISTVLDLSGQVEPHGPVRCGFTWR